MVSVVLFGITFSCSVALLPLSMFLLCFCFLARHVGFGKGKGEKGREGSHRLVVVFRAEHGKERGDLT